MEKGCFEFGGSTIVVFVKKDAIEFNPDFLSQLKKNEEAAVYLGDGIAAAADGGKFE